MLDQQERSAVIHTALLSPLPTTQGDDEPLVAFTAQQVRELTGLSEHQLRYWDKTAFISPTDPHAARGTSIGRIYRFRDVIRFRVIAILANEYHISRPEIQRVARWLKKHENDPLSLLHLFVSGRNVIQDASGTAPVPPSGSGSQTAVPIELATIEREMRTRAVQSREREPGEIGKITRHRNVQSNAWVLAGTRVPTEAVWNFYHAGHDASVILAAYPTLTPLDVQRAIEFEQGRRFKQASKTG